MKRFLIAGAVLCALAVPQAASAKVIELGSSIPTAKVSCPDTCTALTRVTGYVGRGVTAKNPYVIPRAGKIVAFTVRLGTPAAEQIQFFQDRFGRTPQVRLAILRRGKKRSSRRTHRLLAQSDAFKVEDFYGAAPTFVLDRPINVAKDNIAALTVPTWAPVLAVGLGRDTWWRSSRRRNCTNVDQHAEQTKLLSVKVFGCTYFRERPYYTVTYVPNPRPTKKAGG
jgi:hypothetical protein